MIDMQIDSTRVDEHFSELGPKFRRSLVERFGELTTELESRVESGAPRRTGATAASIRKKVTEYDHNVVGKVWSTGGAKTGAIEYGAHNSTHVKPHARTITVVFGRLVGPLQAMISAYERTPNVQAQPFFRPALAGMEAQVRAAIQTIAEEIDR